MTGRIMRSYLHSLQEKLRKGYIWLDHSRENYVMGKIIVRPWQFQKVSPTGIPARLTFIFELKTSQPMESYDNISIQASSI
jgi:hypothetical protein